MTTKNLTHHEFIAVLIDQMKNPGRLSLLWLCLDEQEKATQLEQAEVYFEKWRENELEQAEKRQTPDGL